MKRTLLLISCLFWLLLGANAVADQTQSIQAQSITLPAGTQIAVRTIDRIDSKNADLHKEYAASLDDPVIVNGAQIVPANANAFLRVTDVKNSRFKRASLAISLIAVTVEGQRVEVNTDNVDSQSGSKAKRTATGALIGGGAGAAIGAAAGGAVGAGVGAGVGAAAGAVAGKLTGKGVEIAPETRFTYTLTQAVAVNYQPATPPAPTPALPAPGQSAAMPPIQPPPPPPTDAPTKTIALGMPIAEVKSLLGQPKTIIDLGETQKYIYPDLKITFKSGKVTAID